MLTDHAPDLDGLAQGIRTRRALLRLTQEELGERVGWAQERISTLENGKYGMPSLPQLAALALALELPLTYLIVACGYEMRRTPPPPLTNEVAVGYRLRCAEMRRTIGRINEDVADARGRLQRVWDQMDRADRMSRQSYARMHAQLRAPLRDTPGS
jgi:transcriptional regulator with XRE-family HTH domain